MPSPVYCLACRGVSVDRENNLVSAFAIIERIEAAGIVPATVQTGGEAIPIDVLDAGESEFVLVSVWEKEDGDVGREFEIRIRVVGTSGERLMAAGHFRYSDDPDKYLARFVVKAGGLPAVSETSGMIRFVFDVRPRDDESAEWRSQSYPVLLGLKTPADAAASDQISEPTSAE